MRLRDFIKTTLNNFLGVNFWCSCRPPVILYNPLSMRRSSQNKQDEDNLIKGKSTGNAPIVKIAVGLSGGVDSSVAVKLLIDAGYDVTGVYLYCWDKKGDGCKADEDQASAVSIAAHLGISIKTLDFSKEYKNKVIDYFYAEYEKGRTPNPDVLCNKEIKFGLFLDWAINNGFDYVATGHYALVACGSSGNFNLCKGKDLSKDQSYFLYRLGQDQLRKTLFPLGGLLKKEVREIARKAKLPTANRPDSQGICFVGKVDIKEFLKLRITPEIGDLLFTDGSVIGEHDGVWFYTIGQRHGFRVKRYFGLPLYVVSKNVGKNELVVGYAKDVLKSKFIVEKPHWISGSIPNELLKEKQMCVDVRIRHLGRLHKSIINYKDDTKKDVLYVEMEDDTFGVAPGQSAVLYNGDVVLGGGIIESY
jgi:tRNA-specific 2-thiouridylase